MRTLRIVARHEGRARGDYKVIGEIAFGPGVLAYGTADTTWTSHDKCFEGWRLLGCTDDNVLLGYRYEGDELAVADLETGRVGLRVPNGESAKLSPDGGWLVVSVRKIPQPLPRTHLNRLCYRLFDVTTLEVVAERPSIHRMGEDVIAIARDGLYIVVAGDWIETADNGVLYPLRVSAAETSMFTDTHLKGCAFTGDGCGFGWMDDEEIAISLGPWGKYGHRTHRIELEKRRGLAFHPTRALFATVARTFVEIRDYEGTIVARVRYRDPPSSLCWSPQGDQLALGGLFGGVEVADTQVLIR